MHTITLFPGKALGSSLSLPVGMAPVAMFAPPHVDNICPSSWLETMRFVPNINSILQLSLDPSSGNFSIDLEIF